MTQLQFTLDMESLKHSIMNSNFDTIVKSAIVLILNEGCMIKNYNFMSEKHMGMSKIKYDMSEFPGYD